jgi:putative endonuclease
MAYHNEIGKIGEGIVALSLQKKGYAIVDRNFLRKWGEIDIVARETSEVIHFVEVKSVSYETKSRLNDAISHGTYNPVDNVHYAKRSRLKNVIQTWLSEHAYTGKWQIDIAIARIVPREKYSNVEFISNVIFE